MDRHTLCFAELWFLGERYFSRYEVPLGQPPARLSETKLRSTRLSHSANVSKFVLLLWKLNLGLVVLQW